LPSFAFYEYPLGVCADEMVVWQLGEFRGNRAADDLGRIASFSAEEAAGRFGRTRASLIAASRAALSKLGEAEA
jgi:hypothetical protein